MGSTFTDVIHRKLEWRSYPGLWDPFRVVEVCIGQLSLEVFNVKHKRAGRNSTFKPAAKDFICPGLRRYLQAWPKLDPKIAADVLHYISTPCNEQLKLAVMDDNMKCLQFMLEYFRLRGPFLTININSNSLARNVLSQRHSGPYLFNRMKQLPTLDFCAVVALGRYILNLEQTAVFHQIYYFREIICKQFAPVFIGTPVAPELKHQFPDEKIKNITFELFKNLMDRVPWGNIDPLTDAPRCVFPTDERSMYKKNAAMANFVISSLKVPEELKSIAEANSKHSETTEQSTSLDISRIPLDYDKSYPPDKCSLAQPIIERVCKI